MYHLVYSAIRSKYYSDFGIIYEKLPNLYTTAPHCVYIIASVIASQTLSHCLAVHGIQLQVEHVFEFEGTEWRQMVRKSPFASYMATYTFT